MQAPEENMRQLLREFGSALSESLSSSPEINRLVRKILQEGYSLHVVLDGDDDQHVASIELNPSVTTPEIEESASPAEDLKQRPFRLDSNDVAFLKSVGIDATRPVPRRR